MSKNRCNRFPLYRCAVYTYTQIGSRRHTRGSDSVYSAITRERSRDCVVLVRARNREIRAFFALSQILHPPSFANLIVLPIKGDAENATSELQCVFENIMKIHSDKII